MSTGQTVLIVGASARAAAFSALRAGLVPRCLDLFADADLRARCPAVRVPADRYPQALAELADAEPPGPWLYTGALENRPQLVDALAARRPLWGNPGDVLRRVRDPFFVARLLHDAGLPVPAVRPQTDPPPSGRWLVKPLAGAGGAGIRAWSGGPLRGRQPVYFQEHVEGEPCAAVYVAGQFKLVGGPVCWLLGVTRQLVGEPWLHAGPFRYCGSVGPLPLAPAAELAFLNLGGVIGRRGGVRGLFGVDCVLRDGVPWPVEVNPRYTASVEVVEHCSGMAALAWHRRAFVRGLAADLGRAASGCAGKAVLFARADLTFPADGPWLDAVRSPGPVDELPAFADVPDPGTLIPAGRPVLTFFARAASADECVSALRTTAADLDRRLLGR
jgi:predicted ATP-grasp superfamily ATP-dependent carboligase